MQKRTNAAGAPRRCAALCAAVLLAVLTVILAGCPEEGTGTDGEDVWKTDSTKLNKNGRRVIMEAWGEPEEDPRCLIGYQLEDGTPFFDRYVILYGGRVMRRDCSVRTDTECNKTGLHCHLYDPARTHIYDDAENKIKPLQERGIKVLMSLVPASSGAGIGGLYNWPNEEYWPWDANNPEPYPFGEEETRRFVRDVADELERYHLDGVGYDEEYAQLSNSAGKGLANPYPDTAIYGATSAQVNNAWKKGGENMFRFAWELQQAMSYPIVQDVYEIRFGNYLPETMDLPDKDGVVKTRKITEVFDYTYEPDYGRWRGTKSNPVPNSRYGPISIALADVDTAPLPPPTANGIGQAMKDHLAGNYGIVMYYCFRSRDEIKDRWPNIYGTGHPEPEYYYSMISSILFGQQTIYVGPDYPRMYWW